MNEKKIVGKTLLGQFEEDGMSLPLSEILSWLLSWVKSFQLSSIIPTNIDLASSWLPRAQKDLYHLLGPLINKLLHIVLISMPSLMHYYLKAS